MIASMKRTPGESAGAPADADASADHSRYRESCLLANIETLAMAGKTLENVLAALSRGKVVRLPDGNPAIEVDGQLLGSPANGPSRKKTLADVSAKEGGIVVVFGLGLGHIV